MSDEKVTNGGKTAEQLQESRERKHTEKVKSSSLYNEIDSHEWVSKMEIFRLLSS
jgi:hypothetical protein